MLDAKGRGVPPAEAQHWALVQEGKARQAQPGLATRLPAHARHQGPPKPGRALALPYLNSSSDQCLVMLLMSFWDSETPNQVNEV
jgi:hypothetical protein